MANLKGVLFTYLMLFSSTFGAIYFLTPLIPLVLFQPRVGRRFMDQMIWLWQIYAVALYEKLCGVKPVITGDMVPPEDSSLIVMNHRTRFDWLFVFSYIIRCGPLRRFKITLKEVLKNVPGPGWAMQCAGYLFLHRKWELDQMTILRCLTYFRKLSYKPQILLFPEGTDLTPTTKKKSDSFAKKNNVEPYEYVLHPRTTGFVYLVQKMRELTTLDSVVDVTVGYPINFPQNESDILKGNFPKEVHFHVEYHKETDVPGDVAGIEDWCKKCWKRKEEKLKKYYGGSKNFQDYPGNIQCRYEKDIEYLFTFAILFWTVFKVCVILFLIYSPVLRWFSLFSCLTFITISKMGGVDVLLDSEASDIVQ